MIDPQVQALLGALEPSGGVPLVRGSAAETRQHYRELSLARRGPGFVPEAVADVVDETIEGRAGPLPLRSYTPADDRGRVVTYLHGCRRVANAPGAVVVAVDYRLGSEHRHPAAVDDATTAMAWVAAQMLLYPATDFDHYLTGGPADASMDLLAADVTGAAPDVVATAEFDPLRDEGDAYAAHLRAAGVPVVHIPGPTFDALLDGRTAG